MPSGSSTNRKTTFTTRPPLQDQCESPPPRRTGKRKTSSLPSLTKSQSTLTQRDFTSSAPRAEEQLSPPSSDVDDFDEPRPKKKRKRKSKFDKRDKDQSSMTQYDRGELPNLLRRRRLQMGELEFVQDLSPEQGKHKRPRRAISLSRRTSQEEATTMRDEIPETSELGPLSSQPVEQTLEIQHSPDLQVVAQTPRKPSTRTEVPSSQTPPSTKSSLRSIRRIDGMQRSPLKEKSANAPSPRVRFMSPDSENTSMKMLERVRFTSRQVLLDTGSKAAPSPPKSLSTHTSPEKILTPSEMLTPNLQRSPIVQETQFDEFGLKSTPNPRPRKLKRTATVQDSQIEDIDLESPDHYSIHEHDEVHEIFTVEESQYVHNDYGPATYDPAYSALDRDAARFAQTQTQRPGVRFDHEDSETDVEDGRDEEEPQCPIPTMWHNEAVTTLKSTQLELISSRETVIPPSSPPLPRPTQESVILTTQISPLNKSLPNSLDFPPPSTHGDGDAETQLPPPSTGSPRRPIWTPMLQTMPSSPFPLPPSSRSIGLGRGSQLSVAGRLPESLEDFSLPPPPPLSSSRRR